MTAGDLTEGFTIGFKNRSTDNSLNGSEFCWQEVNQDSSANRVDKVTCWSLTRGGPLETARPMPARTVVVPSMAKRLWFKIAARQPLGLTTASVN
jgi:hypothetical protein